MSGRQVMGRPLTNGVFGENLSTAGLDVTGALVGERWKVGNDLRARGDVPSNPLPYLRGLARGTDVGQALH